MRVDPRTEFTLEVPQETADGAGGVTEIWVPTGQIWGDLRSRPGTERLAGEIGVSQATHSIFVRGAPYGAPSRPTVRQRFRRGVRVFRVVSVCEADPEARFLECRVIEEETA
ncbi:MAG: head-tail adaptor protein [Rhodobacteraceae bacterium]|nr:head-tail adaptor protein [Paracoccaceae bacterium]